MTKFRKSILICGCVALCVIGALVAFLTLSASGMIVSDPIEITVRAEDNQKEYDGTPLYAVRYTLSNGELLKGHELDVVYLGSQTSVGKSEGTLNVKVLDEKKRDVSDNYLITVEPCQLEVTQRLIDLVQQDVTREYNGGLVEGGEFTVRSGTLCDGHRVVRTGNGVYAEVGREVTDTAIPRIYDALGTDVTSNYAIEYKSGVVNVDYRSITVAPTNVRKVYDGTPLAPTANGYTVTKGSLLAGHRLEVMSYVFADVAEAENNKAELTDAGSREFTIADVKIYDENDKEVTGNYSIEKNATATLTVEKCPIKVKGVSGTFTYDGAEHDTKTVTEAEDCDGNLGDAVLTIAYTESLTNAGETDNDFVPHITLDDKDVTANYTIEKQVGKLIVEPLSVTVTLQSLTKQYTGAALDIPQSEYYAVSISDEDSDLKQEAENAIEVYCDRTVQNAGTYTFSVRVTDSSNFTFTVQAADGKKTGTLTVTPVQIGISYTGAVTKIYDGKPLRLGVDFFCSDFTVKKDDVALTDVYVYSAVAQTTSANVNTYTIDVQKMVLYNLAGENVTGNYYTNENVTGNYTYENITVSGEIKKRTITFVLLPVTVFGEEYAPKSFEGYADLSDSSIAEGDTLNWSSVWESISINDAKTNLTMDDSKIEITDSNKDSAKNNYDIKFTGGAITYLE